MADGLYRIRAHEYAGLDTIECEIVEGTLRDAILAAASANARNGVRLSQEDKRRAVVMLLEDDEWRKWSNREIARRTGTSNAFVGKIRRELEAKKTIPPAPERTFPNKHGGQSTTTAQKKGQNLTCNVTGENPETAPEQGTFFPKNETYQQGWNAAFLDKPSTDNPYTGKPEAEQLCMQWLKGWHEYHQKNPVDPAQKEEEANGVALTLAHSAGFEAFKNDKELMENPHDQSEDEESLYQYWRKGWLDAQRSLGKKPYIPTEKDLDAVRQKGFTAFQMGKRLKDNPHHYKDPRFESWAEGFRAAENWTASKDQEATTAPEQQNLEDASFKGLAARSMGKTLEDNPYSEDDALFQAWAEGFREQDAKLSNAEEEEDTGKDRYSAKYRSPLDRSKTWTGLGIKPGWFRELLGQGYTLDQLRIDAETDTTPAERAAAQDQNLTSINRSDNLEDFHEMTPEDKEIWDSFTSGAYQDFYQPAQADTRDYRNTRNLLDYTPAARVALLQAQHGFAPFLTVNVYSDNPNIPADLADLSCEQLIDKIIDLREEVDRLNRENAMLEDSLAAQAENLSVNVYSENSELSRKGQNLTCNVTGENLDSVFKKGQNLTVYVPGNGGKAAIGGRYPSVRFCTIIRPYRCGSMNVSCLAARL